MKTKENISIVIAAFNEEQNIKQLTERIVLALERYFNYEIIYVVAGTDKTQEIIGSFKNKRIKTYHSKIANGLGVDFRKGFSEVSRYSSYVITMDADLNHQPEEIVKLFNTIKKSDADIVVGSRHVKGSKRIGIPWWKMILSDGTNVIFSILSGLKIKDKSSGFRIYKKKVIDELYPLYKSKKFEFLLELLLIANNKKMKIKEAPITFRYRVAGTSKFKLVQTANSYLKLLIKTIINKKN